MREAIDRWLRSKANERLLAENAELRKRLRSLDAQLFAEVETRDLGVCQCCRQSPLGRIRLFCSHCGKSLVEMEVQHVG